MAKKQKGNPLESLLRYEIILALFALIGVYYFLTFSPVRMPRQTITSATIELPAPPASSQKPDTAENRTNINKSIDSSAADHNKGLAVVNVNPDEVNIQAAPVKTAAGIPQKPSRPGTLEEKMPTAPTATAPATTENHHPAAAAKIPRAQANPPAAAAAPVKKPATLPVREKAAPAKPVSPAPAPVVRQKTAPIKKSPRAVRPPAVAPSVEHKTTAAGPGRKTYVIQAGIFIFPDTLKQYQQLLKEHGYTTFVTTKKRLLPMHRVFLGPYADLKAAREIMKKIRRWGDDPFPCRRGSRYYVNVGSFYYQTTAGEKIKQYRARGFKPVTFHESVKVPHHILLVDGFSFDHYPRRALHSIQQLGIPDAFVRNWQP